jgi:hypothetical protein
MFPVSPRITLLGGTEIWRFLRAKFTRTYKILENGKSGRHG